MRDIAFGVSPSHDHAFFKQAQFEGLLGNNFLQSGRFAPQILYLVGRGGTCGIARQAPLAGFEELLRPNIIKALGNALAATEVGDRVLAAQAIKDNPDLLFGRKRPTRRTLDILNHPFAAGRLGLYGFWSHLRSFVTAMRPKSSSIENPRSVSLVLTPDKNSDTFYIFLLINGASRRLWLATESVYFDWLCQMPPHPGAGGALRKLSMRAMKTSDGASVGSMANAFWKSRIAASQAPAR